MRYLYICNTSSDCLSKVNLDVFKEECKITLNSDRMNKIGPHGICSYNNQLLIANSYDNSLSIIDINQGREVENHYIGMHCNDVVVCDDKAYIICGELNNVVVFDLKSKKVIEEIPCGNLPHSIDVNREKKLLLISNMGNDSITLIYYGEKGFVKNVRVGEYPTKALFTVDGRYILVCESNIGSDFRGSLGIVSLKNFHLLYRISLGNSPVDMYCDEKYCYVSNFGDGTVSIVDINYYEELKCIITGGMPRGIKKLGNNIYVGDNYNDLLIKIDMNNESKKVIPIGGEPTGMFII